MIKLDQLVSNTYRNRLFWVLHCSGWLMVGVLAFIFTAISYLDWHQAAWLALLRTMFGLIASYMLRLLYQRIRARQRSLRVTISSALLLSLLVGALDTLLTLNVSHLLGVTTGNFNEFLQASLLMRWMLYWLWSILYFGIDYWLDTQRVQMELAEAEAAAQTSELKALRAQINPHFLFNALGSILAESNNPANVRELTLALSEFLRFSLQQRGEFEPLKTELNALTNYLQVEKSRFGDKLEYRITASDEARATPVPRTLIQPLLENAIKYGQRSEVRPLRLSIDARVEDGFLLLRVMNTGRWVAPETNPSTKTGLANLRRRLQLLYGGRASLHAGGVEGHVVASVRVPCAARMPGRDTQVTEAVEA